MHKLSPLIADRLLHGEPAVLATVLFIEGSVPRTTGAAMAVFADSTVGTVGGGAAEHAATMTAKKLLGTRDSLVRRFDSMCGETENANANGAVTVLLQGLTDADAPFFSALADAAKQNAPAALVRKVQGDRVTEASIEPLSLPRATWTELPDGYRLAEPLTLRAHVYLFGAGHVAQQVAPELARIDFSVTVIDGREPLLSLPCFACAERILGDPVETAGSLSLGETDYAIVMASDHQTDFGVLGALLRQNPTYIGCIGSHKKIAMAKQCLVERGITEEMFSMRVHAPIGLPIRAETPQEIAVSIAAELILHRAEQEKRS